MTTECVAEQRGWNELPRDISNFDHEIPEGLEDELKAGGCWCGYAAWNFHAKVWFEDGKFKAHINRYHSHAATLEADSLKELMTVCSDEYGYD